MLDQLILQCNYKDINNKNDLSDIVESLFIEAIKKIQIFTIKYDVMIKILEYDIKTIDNMKAMRLTVFIDITKVNKEYDNYMH